MSLLNKIYSDELTKLYRSTFRTQLETENAQALILRDVNDFEKVFKSHNIHLSKTDLEKIRQAGIIKARKLNNDYRRDFKSLYTTTINNLVKRGTISRSEIGNSVFILGGWSKLNTVKNAMMNKAISLDANIKSDMGSEIHRGHGVKGLAVSQVDIARGFRFLAKAVGVKQLNLLMGQTFLEKALDVEVSRMPEIQAISTRYNQIINPKGKLVASYVSVITFELGSENIKESPKEKALKRLFYEKFIPKIVPKLIDLKSSSSIKEKAFTNILQSFSKIKSAVLKLDPKYKQPMFSGGKADSTYSVKKKSIRNIPIPKANIKIPKVKESRINLNRLIPFINSRLHDQIAGSMDSPALNYRTGRFANSAKVLSITEGEPTMINYSYDMYPYSIFEMGSGSKLATPARDPRKIIGQSIREIAVGIMQEKFYTRRV